MEEGQASTAGWATDAWREGFSFANEVLMEALERSFGVNLGARLTNASMRSVK